MSLFTKFKATSAPTSVAPVVLASPKISSTKPYSISITGSKNPVQESRDLHRILELPRRKRPTASELELLSSKWTEKLGKKRSSPCLCHTFKRRCADKLLPVQAWALEEISLYGGLLGPIGVGDGKTLLDLLAARVLDSCRVAVLLIPPSLREQLLEVDWEFYSQHWVLPNLAGGRWFVPNLPVLHVVAYSELSGASNTARLSEIRPDTIIADEAQALRNPNTARAKRFNRYLADNPSVRLCAWSGTLTSRSLNDYAHFAAGALGEGSPVPLHYPTVQEWAGALDPVPLGYMPTPPGALSRLAYGDSLTPMQAFARRLEETAGVVSSPEDGNCKASLNFHERKVVAPEAVVEAWEKLQKTWERPDGEALITGLDVARCGREIASGLFNRWRWPRSEPLEVRARWLSVRKAWHQELREKLKFSKEFMDSPLLLTKAAIRWHDGYVHVDGETRYESPPKNKNGPQPTWASVNWPEWREVRETAQPETEAVWIDEFLAQDAAEWAQKEVGIVWYDHVAFGAKVAKLGAVAQFGPGEESSRLILGERGTRSIVASIRSHGTGKNLQPFARNLIANPPSDGAAWEQLLGRTHRTGQLADTVDVHVYRHLAPMVEALDKAKTLARHIQGTFNGSQKLLRATYLFA